VDGRHEARPLNPGILPVAIRRARPGDREAILAFATQTWEGGDYIPYVLDAWLAASDGVCLVAVPRVGRGDRPDSIGTGDRPLEPDRPIAFCRVALLSPTEAWLEGIRVDPAVRGRSVATALQVAELAWAAAHGATVVRYVTGEDNEGSHHLGARHGFRRLADRRSYGGPRRGEEASNAHPSRSRSDLLEAARREGLALPRDLPGEAVRRWWERIDRDPTFRLGDGLYEWRSWTYQELKPDRFAAHVGAGAVLAAEGAEGRWGVGIVSLDDSLEDGDLTLAVLVGDPEVALDMAGRFRDLAREPLRLRLPDPDPPVVAGVEPARSPGGFTRHARTVHLFERSLDDLPEADEPGQLKYLEQPTRIAIAPEVSALQVPGAFTTQA
jgi:RimJ/RimL family protein N-acetyltransferase